MKCEKAEKLILLKDSGEMDDKIIQPLSIHLNDCKPCTQFQQILLKSAHAFSSAEEPSAKILQDILREARLKAPKKKSALWIGLRPILGVAASLLIGLGVFFTAFSPDKVGLELVVTETQLLDADDQIVSVMYSGLSEDDLAFNFLMTYEGNGQG